MSPGFTPSYTTSDTFTPSDQIAVTCRLDGGAYGACGPLSPRPGQHSLDVRARDLAGNETVRSVSFSIPSDPGPGTGGGTGTGTGTGGTGTGTGTGATPPVAGPSVAAMAAALSSDLAAVARALARRPIARLLSRTFTVRLRSLTAGRLVASYATIGARARGAAVLARGTRTVTRAGRHSVTLRLTRAGRAALRRARRLRVRLTIGFTPAGGRALTRSRAVTIKR